MYAYYKQEFFEWIQISLIVYSNKNQYSKMKYFFTENYEYQHQITVKNVTISEILCMRLVFANMTYKSVMVGNL